MSRDDKYRQRESHTIDRRRVLLGTAGAGSLLIAGCSGGGDGGGGDGGDGGGGDGGGDGGSSDGGSGGGDGGPSGRVTMLTNPPGTIGEQLGNGLMSFLTQNTDMTGSAQSGTGSIQNIAQTMRGEAEMTMAVTTMTVDGFKRNDPFNADLPHDPLQLTSLYDLRLAVVCKVQDDFQYVSDLSGQPFATGPEAASFLPTLERAFGQVMDEFNPVHQAPNDMPSQLAADQVKASLHMNIFGSAIPSFAQQIAASNDLRLLGWKEEDLQKIKDNPDINWANTPNSFYKDQDQIDEFVMEGETFMVVTNYNLISHSGVSKEVVYTAMNSWFQNREQLPEIHGAFNAWTNADFWPSLVDTRLPFHPGAAKVLKENDLWQDDFQEGNLD